MAMHRRNFLLALGALAATGASVRAREEIAATAGELTQLTQPGNGDNRATYMPDGRSLLFVSSRSGRSQIWRMDPSGDVALVRESNANDYGRVAPSPDGSRLCFSSDRDGENAIYVLDLTSGATSRISDPAYWSFGPAWSSRDLIAYFSKKGGNRINTWTARPDGSAAKQITDRPGESRQPWWSPDGGTLALSADNGTGAFQIWLSAADGANARHHPGGKLAATVLEPRRQTYRRVRQARPVCVSHSRHGCRGRRHQGDRAARKRGQCPSGVVAGWTRPRVHLG